MRVVSQRILHCAQNEAQRLNPDTGEIRRLGDACEKARQSRAHSIVHIRREHGHLCRPSEQSSRRSAHRYRDQPWQYYLRFRLRTQHQTQRCLRRLRSKTKLPIDADLGQRKVESKWSATDD